MANELKKLVVEDNTYYFKHFTFKMLEDVLNGMIENWEKPIPITLSVSEAQAIRIAESITKEDIISFTTEDGQTISMKKGVF